MIFLNFFVAYMVQKYQNESAPIFYYGKSLKTRRKHLKIPYLQALTLGRVIKMTLQSCQTGNILGSQVFLREQTFVIRCVQVVITRILNKTWLFAKLELGLVVILVSISKWKYYFMIKMEMLNVQIEIGCRTQPSPQPPIILQIDKKLNLIKIRRLINCETTGDILLSSWRLYIV